MNINRERCHDCSTRNYQTISGWLLQLNGLMNFVLNRDQCYKANNNERDKIDSILVGRGHSNLDSFKLVNCLDLPANGTSKLDDSLASTTMFAVWLQNSSKYPKNCHWCLSIYYGRGSCGNVVWFWPATCPIALITSASWGWFVCSSLVQSFRPAPTTGHDGWLVFIAVPANNRCICVDFGAQPSVKHTLTSY